MAKYVYYIMSINIIIVLAVLSFFSMLHTGDLFIVTPYAIAQLTLNTGHLTVIEDGMGTTALLLSTIH